MSFPGNYNQGQGYDNQGGYNQGYNQQYGQQQYGGQYGEQNSGYGQGQGQYQRPPGGPNQGYQRPPGRPQGQSQGQGYSQQSQGYSQQNQGYSQQNQGYSQGQSQLGASHARPSTQEQSFGVDGYNYQYSNCSGKKKALFVGINYIGTSNQLNGCINDCHNVKQFLLSQGFSESDMVVLTDDARSQRQVPTRQNILDAIQWLVKGASANDSLFFHYSGHGGQTKDTNGDEYDGYDEVIYPLDFETNGFIDDDTLHELMVAPLPKGTRLTALFDSCHSGSVLDLPYVYSTKGVLKEPNMLEEAGSGLLDTFKAYSKGDQKAMFKSITGVFKTVMNKDSSEKAQELAKQTKTAPCDAILLSGCKDDQTSADAKEGGQSTGAMSYAFIKVMLANPDQSYLSLLQNMREILQEKYSQKPQLSASHPIDTSLQFIV